MSQLRQGRKLRTLEKYWEHLLKIGSESRTLSRKQNDTKTVLFPDKHGRHVMSKPQIRLVCEDNSISPNTELAMDLWSQIQVNNLMKSLSWSFKWKVSTLYETFSFNERDRGRKEELSRFVLRLFVWPLNFQPLSGRILGCFCLDILFVNAIDFVREKHWVLSHFDTCTK